MDLELRHHRHAVALAEHRHFLRAAKALGISQPALSRSIQELERRAGATLFARTSDGADPTDVGRVYLTKARALLAEASELHREMMLIRGLEVGELRVGAGAYPAEMFVASAIARTMREFPSMRLTAVSNGIDTLLQTLRRRELDVVIGDLKSAEAEPHLRVTPLSWHRAHLTVRAGHPLLDLAAPTLADALRFPLALTSRIPADLLSQLLQCKGSGHDANRAFPAIGCDSPSMMKSIVGECDAIGLMTIPLIRRELEAGTLATLPIEAPWLGRAFAIIELEDRKPSPMAERFFRFVRQADAEAAQATESEPTASAPSAAAQRAARPSTSTRRRRG